MFKNACCFICLSINKRTINVYKTDLQYVYETLANLRICDNECWMCYICHTRLRQCHQLQQLAVQTRGLVDDLLQKKIAIDIGALGSVLELSTSRTKIVTYPSSYITQKSDVKVEYCSNDELEQDEILVSGNDVEEKTSIEFKDKLTKSKVFEVNVVKLNQSGINKYVQQSSSLKAFTEQRTENAEIKSERAEDIRDEELEQDIILESDNDVEEKTSIEFKDELTKSKVFEVNIVKLSQSGIDKYVQQSSSIQAFTEQRTENAEIKSERAEDIRDEGMEQLEQDDGQDNTNDCEGRDHAGEAQSGRYRGPLSCDVCFKKFSRKRQLLNHINVHTGEKPFSCDICSKKFKQKSNLTVHKRIHIGYRPFSCDVCSKTFTHKSHLNVHTQTHTGVKSFSCDICSKKFLQKSHLNVHVLTHSGTKSFSCDICSKKFTQNINLKRHLAIHAGEKPFSCDICSKKFTQKRYLHVHNVIHTGDKSFSCDICSKKFSRNNDMNAHKRIHDGYKPFSCDICSKKFSDKSHLNRHILSHTGEKPFGCDICSKKFTRKGNLNVHKRTHTGEQ